MTNHGIKRRETFGLAAGSAATFLLGSVAASAQQAATVKIGVVIPLSGAFASTGENIKAGADLAIEDINQAGGIKALGGAKLELVVADAEDSADKAKNAAQRLLSRERDLVGGMGAGFSGLTTVVTDLTERAELPWLTMALADSMTERGFRYLFEVSPIASVIAREALPTVLQLAKNATGKQPTTVAVIADSNLGIQAMAKTWRDGEFAKYNVKLVSERTFTPPLSDPTQLIEELRRNRPDFLFLLPSNLTDLKIMTDKLNEFGLGRGKLPTITIGGATGYPELLKISSPAILEGLLGIFANWPGKAHEDLVKRFAARTGRPWMTDGALNGYGEVMIFRDALEKAGVVDRRKVADEIRNMNSTSGAAEFFTGRLQWDAMGRRVDTKLVVLQWQNGLPKTVHPADIATAKPVWGAT